MLQAAKVALEEVLEACTEEVGAQKLEVAMVREQALWEAEAGKANSVAAERVMRSLKKELLEKDRSLCAYRLEAQQRSEESRELGRRWGPGVALHSCHVKHNCVAPCFCNHAQNETAAGNPPIYMGTIQ